MAELVTGLTGTLQGTLSGMGNKVQAWIDSIFPPEKRNELFAKIAKFANERPMLAVRRTSTGLNIHSIPDFYAHHTHSPS